MQTRTSTSRDLRNEFHCELGHGWHPRYGKGIWFVIVVILPNLIKKGNSVSSGSYPPCYKHVGFLIPHLCVSHGGDVVKTPAAGFQERGPCNKPALQRGLQERAVAYRFGGAPAATLSPPDPHTQLQETCQGVSCNCFDLHVGTHPPPPHHGLHRSITLTYTHTHILSLSLTSIRYSTRFMAEEAPISNGS